MTEEKRSVMAWAGFLDGENRALEQEGPIAVAEKTPYEQAFFERNGFYYTPPPPEWYAQNKAACRCTGPITLRHLWSCPDHGAAWSYVCPACNHHKHMIDLQQSHGRYVHGEDDGEENDVPV